MLVAAQPLLMPLNTHGLPVGPKAGAYETEIELRDVERQVVDAPILDETEENCAKVVTRRFPEGLQVPIPEHA